MLSLQIFELTDTFAYKNLTMIILLLKPAFVGADLVYISFW